MRGERCAVYPTSPLEQWQWTWSSWWSSSQVYTRNDMKTRETRSANTVHFTLPLTLQLAPSSHRSSDPPTKTVTMAASMTAVRGLPSLAACRISRVQRTVVTHAACLSSSPAVRRWFRMTEALSCTQRDCIALLHLLVSSMAVLVFYGRPPSLILSILIVVRGILLLQCLRRPEGSPGYPEAAEQHCRPGDAHRRAR